MPASVAGEPSKTFSTRRPRLVLLDVHPDALELARHRLLECLGLLGREVVRVRVVERVDDALERRVVELLLVDRLVEVVLDRVDDLRAQRAVVLHEGVADRAGQRARMPAQLDADREGGERAGDDDDRVAHG